MKQLFRKYYISGIFSLPGIFIFLFVNEKKFCPQQYTFLKYNTPIDSVESHDEFMYQSSVPAIEAYINTKKSIRFYLNADREVNKKKIDLILLEAKKIKYTHDTTRIINITINDECTYDDFIRLLDICYADHHKRFVTYKKQFIIFGSYNQ